MAEWLREQGIEDITLAESSGGPYTPEHMKRIYHVCGMDTIGDSIHLNEDCSAETVNARDGFANHSFHLITPIVKADYIINICKLKNPCHRIFRRYQKSLWNHSGS
ncbi:MAG: DUF362 domain-containing protein [Lachnospiraceae bacterium]